MREKSEIYFSFGTVVPGTHTVSLSVNNLLVLTLNSSIVFTVTPKNETRRASSCF